VIVVDSSAWIEVLRNTHSPADATFRRLLHEEAPLATTEVVVGEVLAGARDEHADAHFDAIAAITELECYPLDAA
jgi:predicted nucleic acid-binding protein